MKSYCDDQELHGLLRELMSQYIIEHQNELEAFRSFSVDLQKESLEQFAKRMRTPCKEASERHLWGSLETLCFCSKALNRPIIYIFKETPTDERTYAKIIFPDCKPEDLFEKASDITGKSFSQILKWNKDALFTYYLGNADHYEAIVRT